LITVDPSNVCNLGCVWCNADYIRRERCQHLSATALRNLAAFLPRWVLQDGIGSFGVDAVCIAGGGEPLLNPATAEFVDALCSSGIHVGLVTNGTQIADAIDALSQCTWVGVSVEPTE
jgi:MoaA/NifB/PqqE/SkfB family radical SAM enzyme